MVRVAAEAAAVIEVVEMVVAAAVIEVVEMVEAAVVAEEQRRRLRGHRRRLSLRVPVQS